MKKIILCLLVVSMISSCGPALKTQRMTTTEGDEKALAITDDWVATDTNLAVDFIIDKITSNGRYKRYLREHNYKIPKLFIGEIENQTSEDNFPIQALNNNILNKFFENGDFDLISVKDRDRVLKEIKYQNSGMVKESDIKSIGNASGADLMLSGEVVMEEKRLGGKTLKEYSLSIRFVDIETGEEVSRSLYETTKYSKQKKFSW